MINLLLVCIGLSCACVGAIASIVSIATPHWELQGYCAAFGLVVMLLGLVAFCEALNRGSEAR